MAKKSNQRKGHPTAAYFLRSKAFAGGWQRDFLSLCQLAASMRRPFGLFPAKASVLGAADGKIKEH
jgi:hypothetical protein